MAKRRLFNTTGICIPELHYMVDMSDRIEAIINEYIAYGEYFTINRARQYGKSTTLELLYNRLKEEYLVLDISFEAAEDCFVSMHALAQGLANKISRVLAVGHAPAELREIWKKPVAPELPLDALGEKITIFCQTSKKGVILMVDEVDKAADNQIFLNFLGLLREKYLRQKVGRDYTFQSVILAGVHDIKNIKMKLHPGECGNYNSPWNIAAEFHIDMGFSAADIQGMLSEYEKDKQTGMDVSSMGELIYEYTSGYPFLVSYLCKLLDEKVIHMEGYPDSRSVWTRKGLQEAVKILVKGPNTLYDDMIKQIAEHPKLGMMLQNILFRGMEYPYHVYNEVIHIGQMFGFIKEKGDTVAISNRIFETQLYSYFISEEISRDSGLSGIIPDKNQFIRAGGLDMDLVMRKFYDYYNSLYRQEDEKFVEEHGRKIFLMYLKPIINGGGNFYVEAETRDKTRTDIIIDYGGKQHVVETKIWRGEEYNKEGEEQLLGYLEHYKLKKGYLLSFDFSKKRKNVGIREAVYNGMIIMEVVV